MPGSSGFSLLRTLAVRGTLQAVLALSAGLLIPSLAHPQDIFQALGSGDRARIDALISEDPTILERPGPRGLNPVDMAFMQDCQTGTDLTAFLLSRGAPFDPSAVLFGRSRLLLATTFGNTDMVRLLLDLGADLETPGVTGGTVLEEAARRGHREIVGLLLAAGADPNTVDNTGNPPLRWAVERGHLEIVDALLDAGASTEVVGREDGMNLLHVGSLYGHLEVVRALLDAGVAVGARDAKGRSPLFYASRYGHRRVRSLLLNRGAEGDDGEDVRSSPSPYLDGRVGTGQAVIWYLTHRGLAMKTAEHFVVFDPEEFGVTRPTEPGLANGFLSPSEIGGENVVVFYSAYHGYVDEPAYVHEIADSLKGVTYVHNAGDEFRGSDRAIFLEPHQQTEAGGIEFLTVSPMVQMSTLGYLMQVDGLRVFYQGFGADDLENYRSEMAFLRDRAGEGGTRPDLGFLPVPDDGVEVAREYLGVFLEHFTPKTVVLHTPPYQLSILPGAEALLRELGFTGEIVVAEFPGDEFPVGGLPPAR
jgi:ankyrin repeat protein